MQPIIRSNATITSGNTIQNPEVQNCVADFKKIMGAYEILVQSNNLNNELRDLLAKKSNMPDSLLQMIDRIKKCLVNKNLLDPVIKDINRLGTLVVKPLQDIIEETTQPFSVETVDGIIKVEGKTKNVVLSQVLKSVEPYLNQAKELRIFVLGTLFMDCDLKRDKFSGKNITIAAQEINVHQTIESVYTGKHTKIEKFIDFFGHKDKVIKLLRVIDVSGSPGHDASSKKTEKNKEGAAGGDASPGGDIFALFYSLKDEAIRNPKLTYAPQARTVMFLAANGAPGGNGQKGGQGVDNDDPKPIAQTQDPSEEGYVIACTDSENIDAGNRTIYRVFTYSVARGKEGYEGVRGHPGMMGGSAGKSSQAGKIAAFVADQSLAWQEVENGQSGKPGKGGVGGTSGPGGDGGPTVIRVQNPNRSTSDLRAGTKEFDNLWNRFQKIRTAVQDNKYGPQGRKGLVGPRGDQGKVPTELIESHNHIKTDEIFADYFLYVCKSTQLSLEEQSSSLLKILQINQGLMTDPIQWFTLLARLEQYHITESVLVKEELVKWLNVYKILKDFFSDQRKKSINPDKNNISPIWASKDWQYVGPALIQKLQYYTDLSTGTQNSGIGLVVDILEFMQYMDKYISDLGNIKKKERQEQCYEQFNKGISQKIKAGETQIDGLQKKIDQLMSQTTENIRTILNELKALNEQEDANQSALKAKKEELENALNQSIILGFFSTGLSLVGMTSGAAGIFSQLGSQALSLNQAGGSTKVQIQDQQRYQQLSGQIERANTQFNLGKLDLLKEGFSDLPDEYVPSSFEVLKQIAAKQDAQQKIIELRLDSVKNSENKANNTQEIKKLEATLAKTEPVEEIQDLKNLPDNKLEERLQALKQFTTTAKHEETILELRHNSLNNPQNKDKNNQEIKNIKQEMLKDLGTTYELKKVETERLKKQATDKSDSNRLKYLKDYEKSILTQKENLTTQKIMQGIAIGANMGATLMGGIANAIRTEKEYKSNIEEINNAINGSNERKTMLSSLSTSIEDFQKNTIQNGLKTQLDQAQQGFQNSDIYALSVQRLEVKQGLQKFKKEIEAKMSLFQSSEGLQQTIQDIQDSLETQIEIYEKMEELKDYQSLGTLIVGVSSQDVDNLSPAVRNFQKSTMINYLKNLYLTELRIFSAWTFPFGLSSLGTSLLKELMPKENMREDLFIETIKRSHESIKEKVWINNFSISKWSECFKSENFCSLTNSGPYFSLNYKDYKKEIDALKMGEEVEFKKILPSANRRDAIKFITMYLDIPQLSEEKRKELTVYIKMDGDALFKLDGTLYKFPQDPITISHGLPVSIPNNPREEFIALPEPIELKLFKEKSLNTGRSPYTTSLSIRLVKDAPTLVSLEDFKKLAPNVAPYSLVYSLMQMGWLKSTSNNNMYEVTQSYYAIQNSKELPASYTNEEQKAIKNLLCECIKLFDIENEASFSIDFMGSGHFLDTLLWKEWSDHQKTLKDDYGIEQS